MGRISQSSHALEMEPHSNYLIEAKPLQIYNPQDPYATTVPLGKPYVPHILYSDPSSGEKHNDPPCHSWAPRANSWPNLGTNQSSVDATFIVKLRRFPL